MKPDKKIRVIVDVNIWISYLIGRRLQKVLGALVLIKFSGRGEPSKNNTILQVKIKEMPIKIKT